VLCALPAAAATVTAAPPLPPAVAALLPQARVQGGGVLTFLGLSIYDGWYWSDAPGWSTERAYALDLHYHRALDGDRIAQRSIDEIRRQGEGTPGQRAAWQQRLRAIFPDVRAGDRITGVHLPPATVRYFHNGAPIGEVVDRDFARAFFGIWLDPRTSQGDYRRKLLGES
jgi:hypothetical protein